MPAVPIIGLGASIAGGLINKKKGKGSTSEQSGERASQVQFDPTALSTYQGLQPQIGSTLSDFMSKPWESGFFQNALTRASEGTGQRANVLRSNLLNPALMAQGSVSNPSAFLLSQSNAIGRGASRERADALTNLLLGSANLRMNAANAAAGYRPLVTGGTEQYSSKGSTTEKAGGSLLGDLLGLGGNILTGSSIGTPSRLPAPPYQGLGSPSFGNFLNNMPQMTPGYMPWPTL